MAWRYAPAAPAQSPAAKRRWPSNMSASRLWRRGCPGSGRAQSASLGPAREALPGARALRDQVKEQFADLGVTPRARGEGLLAPGHVGGAERADAQCRLALAADNRVARRRERQRFAHGLLGWHGPSLGMGRRIC